MKTVTITSMKGGSTKTTSITNLAVTAALDCPDDRFLWVDFDYQGNMSMTAGLEVDAACYSDELLLGKAIIPTPTSLPNVWIIPARKILAEVVESGVLSRINWHLIFKKALATIQKDFDFCFVDTPASYGKLHTLALCASDGYLLAMRPDAYSYLGFDDAFIEVEKMKADFGFISPEYLGGFLSGVPRSKRKAVERIREGLQEEDARRRGVERTQEDPEEEVSLVFEIPLDQRLDEVRWEDGPGFKTIHRIKSGAGDVLEAYENAWDVVIRKLEGVHA